MRMSACINSIDLKLLTVKSNLAQFLFSKNSTNLPQSQYSEPCQASKMEHFARTVNGF